MLYEVILESKSQSTKIALQILSTKIVVVFEQSCFTWETFLAFFTPKSPYFGNGFKVLVIGMFNEHNNV